MVKLLKTDRFDELIKKLFLCTFIAYVVAIEISESALMDFVHISVFVKIVIRFTFLSVFSICAYNFIRGKYTYKELIVGILIFIPVVISVYKCKNADVFMCFAYIFAAKGVNIEKLIKYALLAMVITFAIVVLARILGITKEYIYKHIKYGRTLNRYSFGFVYTCVGTIYYLFISLLYIYVRKERFGIKDTIIIVSINAILYLLTFTLNNFVFIILAVILVYFVKFNKLLALDKIFAYFSIGSAALGSAIISILTAMYASGSIIAIRINSLTSGRLKLTLDAIKKYGISIIGNNIKFIGGGAVGTKEYNYVDSMYMQLLIKHGVLVFVVVVVVLTFLSYKAYKNNNKWLLLCYFIINYHATFDDRLISITLNPFLMFFLIYLTYSFDKGKLITSDGK